ncbi:MAG: sigma-70 family RNA polymerase sigma factor [Proteobacteria bacterium]|nr:sigma-70 family RNA polymerase sigma factor [Pseudomonadota bacterium]
MYRNEAQKQAFEAVMAASPAQVLSQTQVRRVNDPLYLTTEVIVSCLRHHTGFNRSERRRLYAVLDARIKAFAGGFVGRNHSWPQLLKDPAYYKDELACAAWEDLLGEDGELTFAEVAFGEWFKRVAISYMRKEIRRGLTDADTKANPTDLETDDEHVPLDDLESPNPTPEEWNEQVRCWLDAMHLADLTEQERLAFTYHYYLDIPIESKSHPETVSKMMALTPQRIRQILRSAEGKLREAFRGM